MIILIGFLLILIMKNKDREVLFEIGQVKIGEDGQWSPYVKDLKTHDFGPTWVAGMLFLMLDRYSSQIEEKNQIEFIEKTLGYLDLMLEHGHSYVSKH
jgi:hypothetical protein